MNILQGHSSFSLPNRGTPNNWWRFVVGRRIFTTLGPLSNANGLGNSHLLRMEVVVRHLQSA